MMEGGEWEDGGGGMGGWGGGMGGRVLYFGDHLIY